MYWRILMGTLFFATALAAPNDYNVSGFVVYEARGPVGKFVGLNEALGGTFTWDQATNAIKGQVCLSLKEWKSGEATRDDHTRTMFQVSRFGEACLNLERLEGNPTKGKFVLVGTLDLHGVRLPVRIPATLFIKDGNLLLEGRFTTRITDWGMEVPSMMGVKINPTIVVKIMAEASSIYTASR